MVTNSNHLFKVSHFLLCWNWAILDLFQISNYVCTTIQHGKLNLHNTQLPRKKHMYDTRPSAVVNFILSLCLKFSTTCKICYRSTRVRVKVQEYGKKYSVWKRIWILLKEWESICGEEILLVWSIVKNVVQCPSLVTRNDVEMVQIAWFKFEAF
jgi:hypothetical protein